jgi:hypothetical protein
MHAKSLGTILLVGLLGVAVPASTYSEGDAAKKDRGALQGAKAKQPKLYTDEEIQKLSKQDIDKHVVDSDLDILDVPWLDVVPSGKSYPRAEVFKKLKIDDGRIGDFRQSQADFVAFLKWQVSPSYDICCMTGAFDQEGVAFTDPKRNVYGIRLLKRKK